MIYKLKGNEKIQNKLVIGINELKDIEFSKTRELGRVNKVDPIGITYLRIRGKWGISPAFYTGAFKIVA